MAKAPVTIEEKKKKTIPFAGKSPSSKPTPQVSIAGKPPVEPLPPVEIVEKSTIKLDRQIYSRSAFNNVIDTSFGELQKKEDTFSVAQFFQLYNALFFDIPRLGEESHIAIKRRSSEFLRGYTEEDPKANTIDNLNDKILELEQQLLLANQTDPSAPVTPEHPFFRNGTLVAEEVNGLRTGRTFYMDKGFKRKIDYTDSFFRTLLKVLGYESSDDYPGADRDMLSQIKTGPNLRAGNFEQPTSVEEGELIIGDTVTDDTKDAEINRLRERIRQIESGDFSSLPNLDRVSIDLSEIEGIANDIAFRIDSRINQLISPLPNFIKNSNLFQNFIDRISEAVASRTRERLLVYLSTANTI